MRRSFLLMICLVLLFGAGCIGSIKAPESRRKVQRQAELKEKALEQSGPEAVLTQNPDGDGPLKQLNVKGTVLRADRVWSDHRDRLIDQRRSMGPAAFDAYVQRESAVLINDQLGEALLYHDALLRIPQGADARLREVVEDEIRRLITTEYGGVQRRYERELAAKGKTLEGVRAERERRLVISAYLDQEFRPLIDEPTRAELMAIFEERRGEWRRPPKRRMSLIDLRILEFLPEGVTEPSRGEFEAATSAARAEALHLLQSIKIGTPFEQVARESSHGLHAAEGGDWGWIQRGMVRDRFVPTVEALFRLKEGEVGGPVETPESFFIVRCDKIDPGYDPDFEEAQPRLLDAYLQDHYGDLVTDHVAELRRKSGIDMRTLERFHMAVVMDARSYQPEMGPS